MNTLPSFIQKHFKVNSDLAIAVYLIVLISATILSLFIIFS